MRRENQQIEQTDRGFHLTLSGYPRSMPSKMSCIFSPVLVRLTFFALSLHLQTFLRYFMTMNCRNYFLALPAGNSDGCDRCVGLLLFLIPVLDDCDMPSCSIPFSVLCFALLQPASSKPARCSSPLLHEAIPHPYMPLQLILSPAIHSIH